MSITLLTAGKIKHDFFRQACEKYMSRISHFCDCTIQEVAEEKLTKKSNISLVKAKEATRFAEKIKKNALTIVLEEHGTEYTAIGFSQFLERSISMGKPIVFVIGGANGIDHDFSKKANSRMSLGKMTLTQDLARVVFLETLFRGFCILKNIPYHRQ